MSESGTRQVVFAAKFTIIVGAVSLLLLFLPPNTVKTIQEPSALMLLVVGFLAGFIWQHGQLDHFHGESERNESKVAVYTQSNFYVWGSKMHLITLPLIGLIYLFSILLFGRENYYLILRVLSVVLFMVWLGLTSAILFWERGRHLHVYQRRIAPRQWLISFKGKNNLYGDEPVRTRGDQRRE